jgi:hypothetical protein
MEANALRRLPTGLEEMPLERRHSAATSAVSPSFVVREVRLYSGERNYNALPTQKRRR